MAEKKTHTITFPDGQVFSVYDKDAQEKITDLYDKIENIETGDIDLTDYYTKQDTNNLLDLKQNKLVAGQNITIDPSTNIISAAAGAGDLGNYYTKQDTNNLLDLKQNKLVAGNNITIDPVTNIISSTASGGSGNTQILVSYDNNGHVTLSQTGSGTAVIVEDDGNGHITLRRT